MTYVQLPLEGSAADQELDGIAAEIQKLDPQGERMAGAIRRTIDMLLDGQHTGRYRWRDLHKTEKTHCGTLVEINLQREFNFNDGVRLDYLINGIEVDCKYSQRLGGWMIPPEAVGHLLLVVWASDDDGQWSAGLVRAREENLRSASNRDLKRYLNDEGKAAIRWLFDHKPLPENVLLHMPQEDVEAIFRCGTPGHRCIRHGSKRVDELFRRAQGRLVSRNVVATVAQQEDYMKRIRGNGGARSKLRSEGIVIFGQYESHGRLARQLGLPVPGPGESLSIRLARRRAHHSGAPAITLEGQEWVVALPTDQSETAPLLPETKKADLDAE
ncbi:NaeI family type II restriction endonuclease [Nonomuraea angiospora]|uniref:NaeI family type II restriction endonuclease n=1 Tax=Nonomuraea angiospora TaxID=46172 RepID=UPI003403DC06